MVIEMSQVQARLAEGKVKLLAPRSKVTRNFKMAAGEGATLWICWVWGPGDPTGHQPRGLESSEGRGFKSLLIN